MNITLRFSSLVLIACNLLTCSTLVSQGNQSPAYGCFNMRVLLARYEATDNAQFAIACPEGLALSFSQTPKKTTNAGAIVRVSIKNGHLSLNGKRCSDRAARLAPEHGIIRFNNVPYHGLMYLLHMNDAVYVINKVPLEDYIESVLKTEVWPHWGLEEHKVQAIACRSFALYHALAARRKGDWYDVTNTNKHQTYSGVHNDAIIKQAVTQTWGLFLGHRGRPALTLYDTCCGSIIPAYMEGRNFTDTPYLARTTACTHCKDFKVFSWERRVSRMRVFQALKKLIPTLKDVTNMRVVRHDKAGIAMNIMVSDHGRKYYIDGRKLHSMLPDVKSFAYSCHRHGEHIVFEGVGFGHHIGLCQWGAHKMALDGKGFREILAFYYPGTKMMEIHYKADEFKPREAAQATVESVA